MDDSVIVDLYLDGKSMRRVADILGTNHKLIARVLKRSGVTPRTPKNLRGVKKFDCDLIRNYNNMAIHLRFNVSVDWLMQFDDFEKLKLLNEVITNRSGRWDVSTEWYKNYIIRFYADEQFNSIYADWVKSEFLRYKKPSLDHINPRSKGGTNDPSNLQFLTWFENRCKNDMDQSEWSAMKVNIWEYFV